jgi:hypothetical protein
MWATQYTPNNDSVNHPGILSDGRMFTNYIPNSMLNETIKKKNNIQNNEEYRKFLVNNTESIMRNNYEQYSNENKTEYRHEQAIHGPPHLYMSVQEDTKPFGYEDSSVKQTFLTRQQIDDKKRRLLKHEYE